MIHAAEVHEKLRKHQLVDGMSIVVELERSHGSWVYDALTDHEYLDAFTCFASWPVGYNHPKLRDETFVRDLVNTAVNQAPIGPYATVGFITVCKLWL